MLKPHHEEEGSIDGSRSLRATTTPTTLRPLKPYVPSTPSVPSEFNQFNQHTAANAHIVYDTPKNDAPWGWMVSAYLGTKSIGAGVMLVAALGLALYGKNSPTHTLLGIGAPVIGGLFIALTLVLLVADLKRPDRFLYLVTKANPTSWLVWGGAILAIFGLIEAAWFGAAVFGFFAFLNLLLIPAALFGAAAAGYTALLFGQAEGRDFWQSPLLLPILLVQAVLAGAAALGLLAWILPAGSAISTLLTVVLLIAIGAHVLLILVEIFGAHSNSHVAAAAHSISGGALRRVFWGLFLLVGTAIPGILLIIALPIPATQPALTGIAGLFALVGLFAYEHCFVKAGQSVPLS